MTGQRIMFDLRMQIYAHLQRLDVALLRPQSGRPADDARHDRRRCAQRAVHVGRRLGLRRRLHARRHHGDDAHPRLAAGARRLLGAAADRAGHAVVPRARARDLSRRAHAGSRGSTRSCRRTSPARRPCSCSAASSGTSRSSSAINDEHRQANIRSIFYYAVFYPAIELVSALATALLLWFGGAARDRGHADARARWSPSSSTRSASSGRFRTCRRSSTCCRRRWRRRSGFSVARHAGGDSVWWVGVGADGSAEPRRRSPTRPTSPDSPSTTSGSPTTTRTSSCATSRSPSSRASASASSARPAPARRRSSTCCCGSTTSTAGASRVDGVDIRELPLDRAARPLRARAAGRAPVLRHDRRQRAARQRSHQRRRGAARADGGARRPVRRRARRHRGAGRRARRDAVGRAEAAAVVRARAGVRSAGADSRRGDVERRHRNRDR